MFTHGMLMWFAWGVLGLIQLISNRYLKHHWKVSMLLHRSTATIILVVTTVVSVSIFKKYEWKLRGGVHPLVATLVGIFGIMLFLGGYISRSKLITSRWNTSQNLLLKKGHSIFGMVVILMG